MITDKGFQIRQAQPEDIPFIYEVTKEAFEKYVEMAGIQGRWLRRPKQRKIFYMTFSINMSLWHS